MRLKPVPAFIVREVISPTIKTGTRPLTAEESLRATSMLPIGKAVTVGGHTFTLIQEAGGLMLAIKPADPLSEKTGRLYDRGDCRKFTPERKDLDAVCQVSAPPEPTHPLESEPSFQPTHHVERGTFDDRRFERLVARTIGKKAAHSGNYSFRGRRKRFDPSIARRQQRETNRLCRPRPLSQV